MICRYYKEGQKLDVAGLNEITVLIDRTESELTEVALNEWRSGLEGPPHSHAEKDQIFYIVSGEGRVLLGEEEHDVSPGSLLYVPAGIVHRTTTTSVEPLGYILYNIFLSHNKEGHATFKEHIEKVKLIRKMQAEKGLSDVAGAEQGEKEIRSAKKIDNVMTGKIYEFGSNQTILLLDRSETARCEFVVVTWPPNNRGAMVAHSEKEQTFFVLSGTGKVTIGEETAEIKPGHIVFVPRNVAHTTESYDETVTYLCLNSLVTPTKDKSFEEMYNRIAPDRIERWKSGDEKVGE
jgi:mannose-6-phosphate isomerase-like protein (cupin superfamily)